MRGFVVALQFLTCIRIPWSRDVQSNEVASSTAYFPIVGALIGAAGAIVYRATRLVFPVQVCVVLLIIFLVILTRGLHEDGFADAIDGFGGGWDRERVLTIMRDSRIGTFGAIALILLMLVRFSIFSTLDQAHLWRTLVFVGAASRWTAIPLSLWLPYARESGQGKLVAGRISAWTIIFGTFSLGIITSLILPWRMAAASLALAATVVVVTGLYYRKRIGGITGDCMGASIIIAELSEYLLAVALQGKLF